MCKLEKIDDLELLSIDGGDMLYDAAYAVGQAAKKVVNGVKDFYNNNYDAEAFENYLDNCGGMTGRTGYRNYNK